MSKYVLIGAILGAALVSLFFWFPVKEPTPYTPTTYKVPSEVLPITQRLGLPSQLEVEIKTDSLGQCEGHTILACYSGNTIYIPQSTLSRPTAHISFAHEYLHYVWMQRMNQQEHDTLTSQLWEISNTNPKVHKRMEAYKDTNPQNLPTEMYSIVCTEFTILDCKKWLPNGV